MADTNVQVHRFPFDDIVLRHKNYVNTAKRPQWQEEMWLKGAEI
jgi:hypothetical protein